MKDTNKVPVELLINIYIYIKQIWLISVSFPLDDFRKNKNKNLSYFLLFYVHADLYLPFLDIYRGYYLLGISKQFNHEEFNN